MKCRICDAGIETPNYNHDHQDYEPCETCLLVIKETLEGYGSDDEGTAYALEDELGNEAGLWEAYLLANLPDSPMFIPGNEGDEA